MSLPRIRNYDVHGLCLNVEAETSALSESLERVIGVFAVSSDRKADFRLRLRFGTPTVNTGLFSLVWRGEWFPGVNVECYTDGSTRVFYLPDAVCLCLDLVHRNCEVIVRPGQERALRHGFLTHVLCEFLGDDNQHVLHAACLAATANGDKRAVLLAGVSGAGKTTTALALARHGMLLLTDDAAFLVQRSAGLRVWGLPRPCKVHRHTVEMMPWLQAMESRPIAGTEEFAVDFQCLSTGDPREEVSPGLVLLMGPRNDRDHRLQEMSHTEALIELTRQNVRAMHGLAVERAGNSFHAISSLVMQSRVFRLSVGPRLDALHEALQTCWGG